MAPVSLCAALLLAASALAAPEPRAAAPTTAAAFNKVVNTANLKDLVKRDQARAQAFKSSGSSPSLGANPSASSTNSAFKSAFKGFPKSVPAINEVVTYVLNVTVGSPGTVFQLIVDTGSSNTWVGATTPFTPTSTSFDTGNEVEVIYGSGAFFGEEFLDLVKIGPGLVIQNQSIGVAEFSIGFQGVDGIIGIGPVDLTEGTTSAGANVTVPTVTDNLFAARKIPQDLVSVSFEPSEQLEATNGLLTFGGIDPAKFLGPLTFTPVTKTEPSSFFWGIDESIAVGHTTILQKTAGIVDTGTTLILLASDAFASYLNLTGGVVDTQITGLVQFTEEQFFQLPLLNFRIEGRDFPLSAGAQLWPRALNTAIGGSADAFYGIVNDLGSPSGEGFDFINGQFFLERFYSVFDTTHQRVGFAETIFTFVGA